MSALGLCYLFIIVPTMFIDNTQVVSIHILRNRDHNFMYSYQRTVIFTGKKDVHQKCTSYVSAVRKSVGNTLSSSLDLNFKTFLKLGKV